MAVQKTKFHLKYAPNDPRTFIYLYFKFQSYQICSIIFLTKTDFSQTLVGKESCTPTLRRNLHVLIFWWNVFFLTPVLSVWRPFKQNGQLLLLIFLLFSITDLSRKPVGKRNCLARHSPTFLRNLHVLNLVVKADFFISNTFRVMAIWKKQNGHQQNIFVNCSKAIQARINLKI